jgi:hypothetical protein
MSAARVAERMPGGGVVNNHWHIDGVISADNLHKVVTRISREVNQGKVRRQTAPTLP